MFFSVTIRSAAATCLKNILATKTGHIFWENYKTSADPMLTYLQPFRASKKKVSKVTNILLALKIQTVHTEFKGFVIFP